MRGPLPLSDDDFAAVRAAVLARIERRAPYAWVLALAASVVVAVLSGVAARQPIVMPAAPPHVIPSVARDLVAREAPRPTAPVHARHGKPRKHTPVPIRLARIEIHTADPDIRIIWINRQEAP